MCSTPFWKRVYTSVACDSSIITSDIVNNVLDNSRDDLVSGILIYEKYSAEAFEKWEPDVRMKREMKNFFKEMCIYMNVNVKIGYLIICNYLVFEYHGKINEFTENTKVGPPIMLKKKILDFYISERMFMLKTLRHILEFASSSHEFSENFIRFLGKIKIGDLQDKLIRAYNQLSDDELYETLPRDYNRERIEILLILILTQKQEPFVIGTVYKFMEIFKQNQFAYQSSKMINDLPVTSSDELFYAQVGVFYGIMVQLLEETPEGFWKENNIKDFEDFVLQPHDRPIVTSMIALIWLTVKFHNHTSDETLFKVLEVFQEQCFTAMKHTISQEMFQNCRAGDLVLENAHKIIDLLCTCCTNKYLLYRNKDCLGLFTIFLKHPKISPICLTARDGADRLIEMAMEAFPKDFETASEILKTMLSQKHTYKQAMQLLMNLTSFLTDTRWTEILDLPHVLDEPQQLFFGSDLIIMPRNTRVQPYTGLDQPYLQYVVSYTYFAYMEHLMLEILKSPDDCHNFELSRILIGCEVLIEVIRGNNEDFNEALLVSFVLNLNNIIFSSMRYKLNCPLLMVYYKFHATLFLHTRFDIYKAGFPIIASVLFPVLKWETLQQPDINAIRLQDFEENYFIKLFTQNHQQDWYSLLQTFLDVLTTIMKGVRTVPKSVVVSNVMYFVAGISSTCNSWKFPRNSDKIKLTNSCVTLWHIILQQTEHSDICKLCLDALLRNSYILKNFLSLFIVDKYELTNLMEKESNWCKGTSEILHGVRMQIAVLLLLLQQRKFNEDCVFNQELGNLVKPVASFVINPYSGVIAELACRFLAKIAVDPKIPIMALLSLDHSQVQTLFLEKLRDPLEEDAIKLAIIDLIKTCVGTQDGMTAAFFNLVGSNVKQQYSGESVSNFIIDYLKNIKKSHEFLKNPLQAGFLEILHALWSNGKQRLIEDVTKDPKFWSGIMDPLYTKTFLGFEVYNFILQIVNTELQANQKPPESLLALIEKFFHQEYFDNWLSFIRKNEQSINAHGSLLETWSLFIVLSLKSKPEIFRDDVKSKLIHSCLDALTNKKTAYSPIEFMFLWGQLYLILREHWAMPLDEQLHRKLLLFLNIILPSYKHQTLRVKQIILGILRKTIMEIPDFSDRSYETFTPFLKVYEGIITEEHTLITHEFRSSQGENKSEMLMPWMLIVFIGNELLKVKEIQQFKLWMYYQEFLTKNFQVLDCMLDDPNCLSFGKIVAEFLVRIAESPLVENFAYVNYGYFFVRMKPLNLRIKMMNAIQDGIPVQVREWWIILTAVMKLNTTLLRRLKQQQIDVGLTLIVQHDKTLQEIIELVQYTLDPTVLCLITETLNFISTTLLIHKTWSIEYPNQFASIKDGISVAINACIVSCIWYKNINFYHVTREGYLRTMTSPPPELLVSVLDLLNEVIYWCFTCLREFRLNFIENLTGCNDKPSFLLIEDNFSMLRLDWPINKSLSYGRLLCLIDYLCGTVNQLSVIPKTSQRRSICYNPVAKPRSVREYFEHSFEQYTGFMVYIQDNVELPSEKITTYRIYEISGFPTTSMISKLNYDALKNAIDALGAFLVQEIYIRKKFFRDESFVPFQKELSSELELFYDYVRKKVGIFSTAASKYSLLNNNIIGDYFMSKVNNKELGDIINNDFIVVVALYLMKVSCN